MVEAGTDRQPDPPPEPGAPTGPGQIPPLQSAPPQSAPPQSAPPQNSQAQNSLAQPLGEGPPGLLYYAVYLPQLGGVAGPPVYLPAPQGAAWAAGPVTPPPPPAPPSGEAAAKAAAAAAQAHNQRLLLGLIIAVVALIHLPWLLYLFAVHGCWGSFIETCASAPALAAATGTGLAGDMAGGAGLEVGLEAGLEAGLEPDAFIDRPMLFARISYFVLRVQSVALADWAQFSNVLQLSTGLGSFMLTKIVAANGLVAQGPRARLTLAATCATAFVVLFWAEMHLTGDTAYPELADETILSYIDQMMPPEFPTFSDIRASLMQYLQFLRLADALILGAALAMSAAPKKT